MLQANKAQLLTQFTLNSLNIRHLEVRYWLSVFDKFGVIAALLGGFASTVMMMNVEWSLNVPLMHLLYVMSACGALGFNMLLLVISVVCSLWTPGKALTGHGAETYHHAISVMEEMYYHCIVFFRLGLLCYFLTSVFAVFCLFNFFGAVVITIILCFFARQIVVHAIHIETIFVPDRVVSGEMKGNPVTNIAQRISPLTENYKLDQPLFSPDFASSI